MSKWARIDNGVVAELVNTDPTGVYSSDLIFVECNNNDVTVGWLYANGQFTASDNVMAKAKTDKKNEVAFRRLAKEIITTEYSTGVKNVSLITNRDSRQALHEAATSAANNWLTTIVWKTANGDFVTLTSAEVIELYKNVQNNVQQAFATEAQKHTEIDNLTTYDAIKSYDVNQGF